MPGIPDMIGLLVLLVLSPLYMGIAQRVKARCQGRHGPGWTQPYWRLGKTWHKETTVPEFTSWVFRVAPAVSLAALLLVLASVPVAGVDEQMSALSAAVAARDSRAALRVVQGLVPDYQPSAELQGALEARV